MRKGYRILSILHCEFSRTGSIADRTSHFILSSGHVAKESGLGLLDFFGDYLKDFFFSPLQQLSERAQAEPVKEGQQRQ